MDPAVDPAADHPPRQVLAERGVTPVRGTVTAVVEVGVGVVVEVEVEVVLAAVANPEVPLKVQLTKANGSIKGKMVASKDPSKASKCASGV